MSSETIMKSRRSALSPKQLMLLITLFLSIVGGIWQLTLMLPRRLKRRPAAPAPVKSRPGLTQLANDLHDDAPTDAATGTAPRPAAASGGAVRKSNNYARANYESALNTSGGSLIRKLRADKARQVETGATRGLFRVDCVPRSLADVKADLGAADPYVKNFAPKQCGKRIKVLSRTCIDLSASPNVAYICDEPEKRKHRASKLPINLNRFIKLIDGPCDAESLPPMRPGLTWMLDVYHGFKRRWNHMVHWQDSVLPLQDMAFEGSTLPRLPISTVGLHQISDAAALEDGGGMGTDWFDGVLRIALQQQQQAADVANATDAKAAAAANAGGGGSGPMTPQFLWAADFAAGPLCFEHVVLAVKELKQPHFCSDEAAAAFRDHAATRLGLRRERASRGGVGGGDGDGGGGGDGDGSAAARLPRVVTLALRSDERRFLNEEQLVTEMRDVCMANGYELRLLRPRAEPLAAQAAVFAGTAVLIASHGAPHANTLFMPAGGVVIEVLNCGHYTDVSRKLITETGHLYMSTMDNASLECQAAGSDRHSADDRELLRGEWEPALLTALRAVAPLVEEPS